MKIIKARAVLTKPLPELWAGLNGDFICRFDDGDLPVTAKGVILSCYVWQLHLSFPKAPLLKKHYLTSVMRNEHIQPSVFIKLYNAVFWDIVDAYKEDVRDELSVLVYQCSNRIYNDFVLAMEKYVMSLDFSDMVEIGNHPRIRDAVDNAKETSAGVEHCYQVANEVIRDDVDLQSNRQVIAIKAELVKEDQALQNLVICGFLNDLDSSRFAIPTMRGYAAGLRTIFQSLIESRKAATALSSSQGPLQASEYLSRRLQLQSMVFRNLHRCDCGSTNFLDWRVTGDEFNEAGVQTQKGNFKNIIGKYYLGEDGELKTITKKSTHLINTIIKMRSIVAGCAHEDPYGACSTCYGGLADTVPLRSNIAHIVNAFLLQKFGQGILSLKHRMGSATIEAISFAFDTARFLSMGKGGNTYYFKEEVKKKRTVMVLPKEAIPGIVDLRDNTDYEHLSVTRLSKFDFLQIDVYTDNEDGTTTIDKFNLEVHANKRHASLTTEALAYIRSQDFEITDESTYEIELTDWPIDKPLLVLPMIQYTISEHSVEVAKLLESSMAELKRREIASTAESVLYELFELVNSRMDVNLATLEAVLYGGMVVSIGGHDYALPKPWTKSMAGVLGKVIAGRSLTNLLCYEGHTAAFAEIDSFIETNRVDSPMDIFFMPAESLEFEKSLMRP